MPDRIRFTAIMTAAFILAAVNLGAVETDLLAVVPENTPVLMDIEPTALCDDPQGAIILSALREITNVPWERMEKVLFFCNPRWSRWSAAWRMKESSDLDNICSTLQLLPETEWQNANIPVYYFTVKTPEERPIHLHRSTPTDAVIFYHEPDSGDAVAKKGETSALDTIHRLMPGSRDTFIRGAGLIRSKRFIVKHLRSFDFALEKDISGKLLLHGKFVADDVAHAALVSGILDTSLPLVMSLKYDVPMADSRALMKSLNITRKENILYFSTGTVEPFIKFISILLKNKIPVIPGETE